MYALVDRVAGEERHRLAIVTHEIGLTYGDVAIRSRIVADRLRAQGITRIAVADHEAAVVVPVLAGAALAGVEACVYPPGKRAEIADLARRFDHRAVVSDRGDLAGLFRRSIMPGELFDGPDPGAVSQAPFRPHLVLTTGTTGAPRGVRHEWGRLLRGTAHVAPEPGQRWLLAFGLHQFAGLQLLLHVFAAGATLVAPAPRRPREGLAAMRALGVTHASATPTYWRFVLAELAADGGPVPSLRQITLGGESVPGPLLPALRATFPAASLSQVYAASEFGSSGSTRDAHAGLPVAALDRGSASDVDLRVIDGELWVRSRVGMLGYHGEPDVAPDAWRPTGDLVDVVGDRVLFRGRTTEIVNVGGVKVHPLPIEERVAAVEGVAVARAFGRPNPMTGAIVALEVVAVPGADPDDLRAHIRAACADLPPAAQPRSVRFVDAVSTTGGKIVRRELP